MLKGESERINRVLVISFADEGTKNGVFGDAEYLRAREEQVEGAVAATEIIGAL